MIIRPLRREATVYMVLMVNQLIWLFNDSVVGSVFAEKTLE